MARTNPQQKAQSRPAFGYNQIQQAPVDTTGMSQSDPELATTLTGMRGALGAGAPAPARPARGDGVIDKAVRWIHAHLGL